MVDGMNLAIKTLGAERGYIYINPVYYKEFKLKLEKLIKDSQIVLFKKAHRAGYVGGAETTVLNHIEGKRIEPRLRPPYPVRHGLWGFPTLVNNVETFWAVSRINSGEYRRSRHITVGGDCVLPGVYELDEGLSIEQMLKTTGNYPDFDFFVQVGGEMSGTVLNSTQLDREVSGSGSITIYSYLKMKPDKLMKKWADFYMHESCGQCTPCREGTYRIREMLYAKERNWQLIADIMDALDTTSICGLGCSVSHPFRTFINNVLNHLDEQHEAYLPKGDREVICECFE
jgi:NADH:ubiquinone oxidoreductase subunit F (NADH-binding)